MVDGAPASLRVIEEVAARDGVDPVDVKPPLHDVVDPEALDALFRSADGSNGTAVEFPYAGYDVRVESSGTVRVTESSLPTDAESRPSADTTGD